METALRTIGHDAVHVGRTETRGCADHVVFEREEALTVAPAPAYNSSVEYTVILELDAETSTVTASVAELPGCVAQGDTEAEALDDVRSAILEYLSVVADETRHLRQVKVAV